MYQGRYFGANPDYPKYITYGPVVGTFDIHWCLSPIAGDSIVVVEDFISAIKVARVQHSIPMWGSNFSNEQLKVLSSMTRNLIWWVDPDKQRDYPKLVNKTQMWYDSVRCIFSHGDPKDHSTEEIKEKLRV